MPAKVAPDDGAVGAAKMGKKKKKKDDEGGKKPTKTDDDPFGKPDEYPDAAAAIIGSKHLVEFHERSDPTKTLATYSMSFGEKLLPREQVMCWQQIIVFNQMVGRMLDTTSKFAYHTDYVELLAKLCEGVKKVVGVQKVRLFGVDYNSLGMARPQARELWLVGGERSLLGHTVALEEYAGCSATGPPNPIVAHSPTDDHKKYGMSYIDMDTRAKFHCDSLCSVGVRMRGPLSAKARPRYVLEVYNKQKVLGKGSKDFDETDAYITGCVARACGSAIAWVLGNMQNRRCSEFAHAVLATNSLKEFAAHSQEALCRLFNCEEAVLFWVDDEHNQLWRFPTAEETKRNERLKQFMDKEFITQDTVSLVTEAYKKVDMSGTGAQFVLNVPNAQKHPKFNSDVDEKYIHRGMLYDKKAHPDGAPSLTRCVLSLPVANTAGHTICVIQLRNKLTDKAVQTEFNKSGVFRTDDATFLQHLALQASSVFEHALAEEEGREAVANREQSEYCARSLMHISLTLAKGDVKLDDLFPLVVSESIKLINCDRATLFLVHEPPGSDRMLWSKIATGCPPIMVPLKETSIAGATVCNSVVTNIADAYRDIRFDPQWDRKSGYRTRSILCVPIIDQQRGGKCVGCLQLINKKDRYDRLGTVLFNKRDVELATNLASVVSIAVKCADQEQQANASLDLAVGICKRRSDGPKEAAPAGAAPAGAGP